VSGEHVKLLRALLFKAVQAGWITEQEGLTLDNAVKGGKSKKTKAVKSPELGT